MTSGEYAFPDIRRLIYGVGALDRAAEVLAEGDESRVFVIASSHSGAAVQHLRDRLGHRFAGVFDGVTMHVGRDSVLAAAQAAREAGAEVIVSIGGGTAIDCAKAVTLCLGGDVTTPAALEAYRVRYHHPDGLEIPPVDARLPRHIAVPTTLSGAESTTMFGVTDPITRQKAVFVSPRLAVTAIVLDPWVARGTPDWLWASSGMRAVDHAVEGVLSSRHMPLHDATGLEGLRILRRELVGSARDPGNADARTACQLGAWLSTISIGAVGVGLSHAIGHQLAPQFDMAHGVTSAVMLPHVMEFNRDVTVDRLARIAEPLGCHTGHPEADAVAAIAAIREFVATLEPLGVPRTLQAAGADRAGLALVADHVMADHAVATNPKPVTREAILALLHAAWD
jgi:alcohol dehydrogenase